MINSRLQLRIFGKALAQHVRWEAGEDERGERGREIALSHIKSHSVFWSNCLEPLLDTVQKYFAIHWCTGGPNPRHANTLVLYEWGKHRDLCRTDSLPYVMAPSRYEVMASIPPESAQWRLSRHYTKTWIIWAEQRCVGPGRKSELREMADKFCY